MDDTIFKKTQPIQYYKQLFTEGIRHDGRDFSDFRKYKIRKNVFSNLRGSATLKVDHSSSYIAGVSAYICCPSSHYVNKFKQEPNSGVTTIDEDMPEYDDDGLDGLDGDEDDEKSLKISINPALKKILSNPFSDYGKNTPYVSFFQVKSQPVSDNKTTISYPKRRNIVVNVTLLKGAHTDEVYPFSQTQAITASEVGATLTDIFNMDDFLDIKNSFKLCIDNTFNAQSECDPCSLNDTASVDSNILPSWHLDIDILCVEYGGNLLDMCLLCSLAALEDTKLPFLRWNQKYNWWTEVPSSTDYRISNQQNSDKHLEIKYNRIKFRCKPLCLTFCYPLKSCWIVDPTKNEEQLGDSLTLFSKAIKGNSNGECISKYYLSEEISVYKSGGYPIDLYDTVEELKLVAAPIMEDFITFLDP